jgi:putative transposase
MPRPPRADEAGGLYQALNRDNGRIEIFHKAEDFAAFESVLAGGLASYDVTLFCFQLMSNHWHLALRPNVDGELDIILVSTRKNVLCRKLLFLS